MNQLIIKTLIIVLFIGSLCGCQSTDTTLDNESNDNNAVIENETVDVVKPEVNDIEESLDEEFEEVIVEDKSQQIIYNMNGSIIDEAPKISILNSENYDEEKHLFYIFEGITEDREIVDYVISTDTFIVEDDKDIDPDIIFGYDSLHSQIILEVIDSDSNIVEWLIPVVMDVKPQIENIESNRFFSNFYGSELVNVSKEYLRAFPEMEGKYSTCICKSADGVGAIL